MFLRIRVSVITFDIHVANPCSRILIIYVFPLVYDNIEGTIFSVYNFVLIHAQGY